MKKGREEETLTKKGSREIDNLDGGLNATGLVIGGKEDACQTKGRARNRGSR